MQNEQCWGASRTRVGNHRLIRTHFLVAIFISTTRWRRVCFVLCVFGWHDLDNSEYDCWPLEKPDELNMIDCGGLEMAWVLRPPEKVLSGEDFSVIYSVTVREEFYQWAIDNDIFIHRSITDPAEARRFCEQHDCPADWKDASGENCCIHHANIHSCPMGFMAEERICGPWIPDDGRLFTHTISTSGKMSQTNWSAKVVLFHEGLTSLIAHIRVGNMQVALEAKSTVLPAIMCGDGLCEEEESCSTCPADCGDCPLSSAARAAIALTVTTIIISFIISAMWFKYQKQKLFWDESWIIDFNHIKQDYIARATMGSIMNGVPVANSDSNASCVTALSSYTGVTASRKQLYTQTGIYDGRTVAIKKIKTKTFSLSKTIRQEVKQVRELDHPNLCKFFGGCVEVPNIAIITEYCPKGSLNDVLLNDEIPLNWGFRFSFATDIARGMSYLHQFKICHGRLKSANCVIDVCMISNRQHESYDSDRPSLFYVFYILYHVNVYFISSNSNVFFPSVCEAEDSSLECGWCPPLPELISGKADSTCPCPAEYAELIRRCRGHNPTHRPTFEQIRKFVNRINPHKVSPVDMMMELMEKYSKHLEVLVGERTQDLMLEKQKTDRLLYSMLPIQVADDLRQGKPLQAQSYVSATVFFSDIVGFTQLSSTSTPYQVVDFLNKLYTTFDEIIDNHDVYKVETIGDACMLLNSFITTCGLLVIVCSQFRFVESSGLCSCVFSQGKGDMVTYWLEGKRAAAPAKDARNPETHTDDYSSIPGVLSGSDSADLLCDP
uniref:guanylate cyclase n=1 Tax=Sinocyclocheilus grahami TaxID=75366 RepID=A0A672MRP3_SINGR